LELKPRENEALLKGANSPRPRIHHFHPVHSLHPPPACMGKKKSELIWMISERKKSQTANLFKIGQVSTNKTMIIHNMKTSLSPQFGFLHPYWEVEILHQIIHNWVQTSSVPNSMKQ